MMKNKQIAIYLTSIILLLSTSCSPFIQTNPQNVAGENKFETNEIEEGEKISLPDGASLEVAPGSLPSNIKGTIDLLSQEVRTYDEFNQVGGLYEISFGGISLDTPATLTLPYIPSLLPTDIDPQTLFIAYFDEDKQDWVYVGGDVDINNNLISVKTNHASRWSIFYWNWEAWIAILNKTLGGEIISWLEAIDLLTNDCPQTSESVWVENLNSQNLLQGCVEKEDGLNAQFRVVNPKSFYYEIKASSKEQGITVSEILSPGDSFEFEINLRENPPFTVSAEITQEAGFRLVLHLILKMLPGFNAIEGQPQTLACITERVKDVSYFTSAVEELLEMETLSGLKASEQLIDFFKDKDAIRRFIEASDDCVSGLSASWSVEKVMLIGNLSSVIISGTDYIANYLAMMFRQESQAQVSFQWRALTVDKTNPQAVVDWVKNSIELGDASLFADLIPDDGIAYANYLEGGQFISKDDFLNDLQERINSQPSCQGIFIDEYGFQIWYSNWQPAWQMTEICYVGCNPISWESNSAAFFVNLRSGEAQLGVMYLNTPQNYFFMNDLPLVSCNMETPLIIPTPVSRCEYSPAQRLVVGERGKVCTKSDPVRLRENPGKDGAVISSLPTGTAFDVIAGPECAGNNWSWWKVRLDDGQVGWLAEGGDITDAYFLCPLE